MKTLKLITGILLVFALIAVTFSCTNQKKEKELKKVTVAHWGHSKILIYLPLYVAIDGGFFEKNGLDVRIKYSGNDDQVYATVLSGDAQFGVGDPAFTVVAGERGGKGKIIATLVGN
jgi:NitT/TauT family transport system substrate-binding protein